MVHLFSQRKISLRSGVLLFLACAVLANQAISWPSKRLQKSSLFCLPTAPRPALTPSADADPPRLLAPRLSPGCHCHCQSAIVDFTPLSMRDFASQASSLGKRSESLRGSSHATMQPVIPRLQSPDWRVTLSRRSSHARVSWSGPV
jgi:hypothetical protein